MKFANMDDVYIVIDIIETEERACNYELVRVFECIHFDNRKHLLRARREQKIAIKRYNRALRLRR